jgi:hypothetical protein
MPQESLPYLHAVPLDIDLVFLQEHAYEGRNVHPGPAIATY